VERPRIEEIVEVIVLHDDLDPFWTTRRAPRGTATTLRGTGVAYTSNGARREQHWVASGCGGCPGEPLKHLGEASRRARLVSLHAEAGLLGQFPITKEPGLTGLI
jgi:hypothetical protein